jgi:hypothetical protein
MGLDEDGNVLLSQFDAGPHTPLKGTATNAVKGASGHVAATGSPHKQSPTMASDRRMSNAEAKLRELDSPLAARLVDSPYKAKSTEKYPVKVMNPLSQSLGKDSHAHGAAAEHAQHKQRPSSSPAKRSDPAMGTAQTQQQEARDPRKTDTRPHSSPKRTSSTHHPAASASSHLRSAAQSYESPHAQYAFQESMPLPESGSQMVGGAVKSSFLTDLGFPSAEAPSVNDAYLPPRDVQPEVLVRRTVVAYDNACSPYRLLR